MSMRNIIEILSAVAMRIMRKRRGTNDVFPLNSFIFYKIFLPFNGISAAFNHLSAILNLASIWF
jgi:hypothetical protein